MFGNNAYLATFTCLNIQEGILFGKLAEIKCFYVRMNWLGKEYSTLVLFINMAFVLRLKNVYPSDGRAGGKMHPESIFILVRQRQKAQPA